MYLIIISIFISKQLLHATKIFAANVLQICQIANHYVCVVHVDSIKYTYIYYFSCKKHRFACNLYADQSCSGKIFYVLQSKRISQIMYHMCAKLYTNK